MLKHSADFNARQKSRYCVFWVRLMPKPDNNEKRNAIPFICFSISNKWVSLFGDGSLATAKHSNLNNQEFEQFF